MITTPLLSSHRQRLLLAIGAAALALLLMQSGLTRRLDTALYDLMAPSVAQSPDPRVLTIAIDDRSMVELGRWPWSRRVHAQMIDRLRQANARGVAMDVLLSQPALHDPEGDALLARALARSGRVVLPVHAETARDGSVELLPIPEFAAASAALGHVDVPQDGDGVVRGHFLYAGLGSPQWPSLALALHQLDPERTLADPLGRHDPAVETAGPRERVRDRQVLVPFAAAGDAHAVLSYADVLAGRVPDAELAGRWVLIGLTAGGFESGLAVPGRDAGSGMTRLEYQANAFDMLLGKRAIVPMPPAAQILLTMLLAALPLLLHALPPLQPGWRAVLAALALAVLLPLLLLHAARMWYPPAAPLLVVALTGLFGGYGLMRRVQRRAQLDPLTGLANRSRFDAVLAHELVHAQRNGQPLSLLVLDVDRFRQFEGAREGHGEAVLRTLARVLGCRARRPRDLVARLGGDRFAVLLPETSSQAAATIATTVHVDLANLAAAPGQAPPFSTSIGIHTWTADDVALTAGEMFGMAEAALYRAKQASRLRGAGHAPVSAGAA